MITIPGETLTLQEYQGRLKAIREAQRGLEPVAALELERIVTALAEGSFLQ